MAGVTKTRLRVQENKNTTQKRRLEADLLAKLDHEAQQAGGGLTCASLPMRQRLCMSMLSSGKPKAFIEFFQIVHGKGAEATIMDANQEIRAPPSESIQHYFSSTEILCTLSKNLVEAEMAARNGDYEKTFQVNNAMAKVFEDCGDYNKAIFYYSRCLANAKSTCNCIRENEVKFNLGRVHVKLRDSFTAKKYFEEYFEFARESAKNECIILGSEHLLQVYTTCALEAKQKGELEHSITFYEKVGESRAHCALAEAYEALGEISIAVEHLEAFLGSAQLVDLATQALACCRLGMFYNRQQNYENAIVYFQRFFEMSCILKDPNMMDAARVNLCYVRNKVQ